MKKIPLLLLIVALCMCKAANSQDTLRLFGHQKTHSSSRQAHESRECPRSDIQTLTGPGHSVGFYFGFHSEYSQIAGYDAFGIGGTFAMIANHGFAIGLRGKGFFSEPYEAVAGTQTSYSYTGGYGGILIEPIVFPRFPVHVSFPILLGAGGIAKNILTNYKYPYDYTEVEVENAEAYLIAEPGMEIELNVTRWMRLGLNGSYRFTTTFEPSGFDSNPMNGFRGGFSLKFGKF